MRHLRAALARIAGVFGRSRNDDDLRAELQVHLEMATAENVRRGMPPDEARRQALLESGGVTQAVEAVRDQRGLPWVESVAADIKYAFRVLRRSPVFAAVVAVTLALGIGANVAIFSAVNAVLLRPLPFAAPDRLVVIGEDNRETGIRFDDTTPANYFDWRDGVSAFRDAMAHINGSGPSVLAGRGEPRLLETVSVTGNFFSVLGVHAAVGRTLREEETWASSGHVAVLSDRAWRAHFGADSSVVGATVLLDGTPVQVVGVMPPRFDYPSADVDVWRSIAFTDVQRASDGFRQMHYLRVVARLQPGVTFERADAQLRAVSDRLARERPQSNRYTSASMQPMHRVLAGDVRLPLLVLLTSVGLLLLIACANVGNLLLVQASGRRRETSLRLALGAGRFRVVRQALTESLVLSLVGGVCGLAIGWAGTHALVALQPADMLPVQRVGVDARVMTYVVIITLASALTFGAAPALWMQHRDPAESLRGGGRGVTGGRHARRWRDALVVAEVALALLMTVGAGLLVRSLWHIRRVDPGFDPRGVLAVNYSLNSRYDTVTKVEAFNAQFLERARAVPGVTSAATTDVLSLGSYGWTTDYIAAGRPADAYGTHVMHRIVSPSYFETMKIPLLRGRSFTAAETRGGPRVVVINEVLARSYFRGQDPVGQRIAFERAPTADTDWYTIVGVVGAERTRALDIAPRPEVYESVLQTPRRFGSLLLRTAGDPAALTPAVRALVRDLDSSLPLYSVRTMESLRAASMGRAVFLTTLLLTFAVIGVVLAVVGVYGVLAHSAGNRTREMGIRLALGALSSQVRWLVVREGLRLVAAGLIAGGVVALLSTRAMAGLLYNVAPHDPLTLVGVAGLLAATGAVASWLPAVRASRADPVLALRAD